MDFSVHLRVWKWYYVNVACLLGVVVEILRVVHKAKFTLRLNYNSVQSRVALWHIWHLHLTYHCPTISTRLLQEGTREAHRQIHMWRHPQILWHHFVTRLQTILATNHLIHPTFITIGVANQQICNCLLLKTPCKIRQGAMEPTQWSTTHWAVGGLIQYYNNFLALLQLRS